MSYISVLIPGFKCISSDLETIVIYSLKKRNLVSKQFSQQYDLIQISNSPLEYAIKFNSVDFSLEKIEEIICQSQGLKVLLEKTFEALSFSMEKLDKNDKVIKNFE